MRFYADGDKIRITRSDIYLVDVEFFTGEKLEKLEPRRLFPISGLEKYITLLDADGNEKLIIRDMAQLSPDSRVAVEECLSEYYMIPKIKRLTECSEKFGVLNFTVETERGIISFRIKNRQSDIKLLYGKRVLLRDSEDNRYEIPDITTLDKSSMKILYTYI